MRVKSNLVSTLVPNLILSPNAPDRNQLSIILAMSHSTSFPSLDQVYPRARPHYTLRSSISRSPSPSLSEVSYRSRSPLSFRGNNKSMEAKSKSSSEQKKQYKYNRRNVLSIDDVNLLFDTRKRKHRGSRSKKSIGHEQQNNRRHLYTPYESSKSNRFKSGRTPGQRQYKNNQTNIQTNDEHIESSNYFFPSSGPLTSTWSCDAYENISRDMTKMTDSLESLTLDLSMELWRYDLGHDWSCDDIKKTLSWWDMTWISDSHETLNLGFDWSYDATEEKSMKEVNDIINDEELNNLANSIIN